LLLLADGRLPTGGHVHSGGVEEAVTDGRITRLSDLRAYLTGRLWTTGVVDAGLAVAAARLAAVSGADAGAAGSLARPADGAGADASLAGSAVEAGAAGPVVGRDEGSRGFERWELLDAEAAARTPSPALRKAARTQGRGLLRAARRLWPSPILELLVGLHPDGPFWPVTLGAAACAAGADPAGAGLVAAQASVSGPAWAAVRLLGLDPFAVAELLAALTPSIDAVATDAVAVDAAALGGVELACLSAAGGPLTDVAAEAHASREVRLFAS
jgi:urease accessory protein UreF